MWYQKKKDKYWRQTKNEDILKSNTQIIGTATMFDMTIA